MLAHDLQRQRLQRWLAFGLLAMGLLLVVFLAVAAIAM